MRSFIALLFVSIAVFVSGCTVSQVKGELGGVEVEARSDGSHDHDGKGYHRNQKNFCPPGQAKKGNC